MTPKTVLILGAVTAVSLAAAVGTAFHGGALSTVQLTNDPAFPALHAAPDAVARVEVRSAGQSFSLARSADGQWRLPEKHDYPVAGDKLRELVVTLTDMRLVEAKTRQPARYSWLEVEDIEAEDAQSTLLRLKTADDKVLDFNRRGFLQAIHAHLMSLRQVGRLANLKLAARDGSRIRGT